MDSRPVRDESVQGGATYLKDSRPARGESAQGKVGLLDGLTPSLTLASFHFSNLPTLLSKTSKAFFISSVLFEAE
jgi:hypothetical protein